MAIKGRHLGAILVLAAACAVDRVGPSTPSTWDDVAPILQAKCSACHSGSSAAAGFVVTSYVEAISCPNGSSTQADLLAALDQPPHVGLVSDDERATIASWASAGSPAFTAGVHTPDFADPRSPNFHAPFLRSQSWRPMLDPNDPSACGRCHDGAPSRPASVTFAAPGAPSCDSCHSQSGGIFACGTCHGTTTHAYPPRDPCFFPNDASGGAHAAHVEKSAIASAGLPCSTCHPVPGDPVIGGSHADGAVEVVFDPSRVAPEMSWDPVAKQCAVSCHDRGGARPKPTWSDTKPMGCNDCHSSPPANHYAGACTLCHAEANADGTALSGGPLHMNGKVDLGDGSGTCGACHGKGADPWPRDATHQAHENPTITTPIACSSCHVVPSAVYDPGHLGSPVKIQFSGRALDRGSLPAWDGTRCTNVACHGANLNDPPASPAWNDMSGNESKCGACHGIPPTEHTTSTDCNRSICHGAEVSPPPNLAITQSGLSLHINGTIDVQ